MRLASSPAQSAPSIEGESNASGRNLLLWIGIITCVLLGATISVLAVGGRPDPPALRAAAPLLNGTWRFHIGDDPRWAEPTLDDNSWEITDLSASAASRDGDVGLPNYVAGWMAHGHPGYHGYAWYRRSVTVPAGNLRWDILGPTAVDHGYELYWNGAKLGGSGRLGTSPKVVGTRPMIFSLPASAAGRRGVLAIRVFMQPGYGGGGEGGGIHVAPTIAPQPESRALYHVEWWRTIAGYIVEVTEPVAMFLILALALAIRQRSSHREFLWWTCIALALSALKRLDNAILAWTDLLSLPSYVWLTRVVWMPFSLVAWTLAWNRWCMRASRPVGGATLVLALAGVVGGAMHLTMLTRMDRYGFLALLLLIAVRILRHGPMRILAVATMVSILAAQFADELSAIHVPGIWFPFGIGVSRTQYAYALAIPLLAVLVVRTLRSRSGPPPSPTTWAGPAANVPSQVEV